MKGHTFKITLGLIEEVLPGLDVYLRFTLAREKLSQGAESTRGYFIERLDVLTKKPYEVWDRVPREFEIQEPVPPKVPPRIRKPVPTPSSKIISLPNGTEQERKIENKSDEDATSRVSNLEDEASVPETDGKLKPTVPPKPEHLVTLVRSLSKSRPRSGYYNQSRMKPPEADGEAKSDCDENTEGRKADVTLKNGVKVKVDEGDGGEYEPVGQNENKDSNASAILDSNANIDIVATEGKEEIFENQIIINEIENAKPSRKTSSVSVLSQDSALGFNLDIPKIDCKSSEDMLSMDLDRAITDTPTLKTDLADLTASGREESPPTLPKRPQFLSAKPRMMNPPSPKSSPRIRGSSPVPPRSPVRPAADDAPPPLPPRKKVVLPGVDSQPEAPPSDEVEAEPPTLPPLPPRPADALGPLNQREGETEDEFVARQRMISRSNAVEEEEEGDYDTIDKSDAEEGSKSAEKKKKKLVKEKKVIDDSDATSYESYDDMDERREAGSSQENIIDPVLASKENLTASPYSLTFPRSSKTSEQLAMSLQRYAKEELQDQAMTLPRFRSFRKSKRKANKGSLDNISLCQQNAAILSGELQYKAKYQWTRRFCIITSEEFMCYKTERDSRPVLTFMLKDFDVAYIEKEGKKHNIIRLSHPGFDTHLFSVDSRDRADMWLEQFNTVGRIAAKNRMSAGSLDGARTEDSTSTSTPSQLNSRNSLSNISQASSSDSTDTHSYSLAPSLSLSGSQFSMVSTIAGSKESVTPSPKGKHHNKRPLSTPSSRDVIDRAIVLSNPASPYETTPSPSHRQRRHSHHTSGQKSRRTSQIFGSWGKKKTKKSTQGAEMSAPMNFEVYEGSAYDVSVSGYMNVKSQFSSNQEWTKKYCRIKNGFFECYKDITDYRHEFNFPLVGCEIVTAREPQHDLALKVVQGDIEKVFIEPGNILDQGRWLAVLIKETTCCSQPPPGLDYEDEDGIPSMVLTGSGENLDEKVFLENDVASDGGSDGSDGYEQQAIQRNSFRDEYDELKEADSDNDYIENYGPEVLAAREAMSPGRENVKNLDDGYTKIKDDRLKSDSEIIVRPKTNILDMYAKVDKRISNFSAVMTLEESLSKRSSVVSEYSDILSAVLKVSKQYTDKDRPAGFGRSMSFDTGTSLRAAVEKIKDLDAIAAKEYESFQELHNSRAGSSERELQSSSGGKNSLEGVVLNSSKDESTVISPPSGDSQTNGATIDVTVTVSENSSISIKKSSGKTKGSKSRSRRPHSEILYPEISNSFGSLDEIYTSDSSLDDDESGSNVLPNLEEANETTTVKNSFYELSDRKKDSGICGDSNESISALIKDEGSKVQHDSEARLREGEKIENSEKRRTVDSIDKVLAGTFVNTSTSVYAKEVPVSFDNSCDEKNSSQECVEESDHEYDDIDEKKRNSNVPPDDATNPETDTKVADAENDENVYDEIDKENEGQGSEVVAVGDDDAEAGSEEHHDYADVDDKEKADGDEEESDHDYDPIEFTGNGGEDDDGQSSVSEYEEYEDHEEESIETKQRKAIELHAEVRIKKKEWAQVKKLRLALENQRIQSRDPEEKKRLIEELNDLEEKKIKVVETELAAMIKEHQTLSTAVTVYFQSHGLLGRKMSMISVESLMMSGR